MTGLPILGTGSGFRWVPTGFAVPRNQVPDVKVPGSEGCVPEVSRVSVFDGFRRLESVREVWTPEPVPETRGIKKVPGSGRFRSQIVTLCFGRVLLYFEIILLYSESIVLYFESMFVYFESILLYF